MKEYTSFTLRFFKKQKTSPFIEGMASILDNSNSDYKYNFDKTDSDADRKSIQADWKQVGADLQTVMMQHATK